MNCSHAGSFFTELLAYSAVKFRNKLKVKSEVIIEILNKYLAQCS